MVTHMHLDFTREQGIPLSEVPRHLPNRNGKKIHYSTIYRWATKGARGRILETALIGGVRYTTVEALHRFQSGETATSNQEIFTAIDRALADEGL